jgi:leucyl-tRNA synthetase
LLYARFYTKFLYDIGAVEFDEPFIKLFNQGMITNNGRKMDKSGDNSVSPDAIVRQYGSDSLRMYELFVGPPELDSEWDERSIEGVNRYLNRVWKLIEDYYSGPVKADRRMEQIRNKMIYEITSRLEHWSLNTVVSGFMEYTNKLSDIAKRAGGLDRKTMDSLIIMLAPFVPHLAEEIWRITGRETSVFNERWPEADESMLAEDTVSIALQINGKSRGSITISADEARDEALAAARRAAAGRLEGKTIVKEIYVPGRIVNFVVNG